MCQVYYPVASVLIHACLFLLEKLMTVKTSLPPEGAKASVFAYASWAMKNFRKAWNFSKCCPVSQSYFLQAIDPIRVATPVVLHEII